MEANVSFSPPLSTTTSEPFGFPSFPGDHSPYTSVEAVIIALVLLCVIIGTVVGNILVCVAVCLVRKLRRPCNYLLVSLAVSDLCVALLVMPMALLYEILGVWSFGPVLCDLWVSFDVLSCTASILNLCMISVDRYYAITKPLEYGVKRTPRRMIACVSLVWLGAACISLPPLLILGNEHVDEDGDHQCIVCQNFGYQIYATLGSFYIPLTVMIVVYYKIFRAARKIVLEERRAQSHLETPNYLEISVRNGGGPPETRIAAASSTSSPAGRGQHHRPSTTSTNTTNDCLEFLQYGILSAWSRCFCNCSGQTGISSRCFASSSIPRRSNESQCPMLAPHKGKKKKHMKTSPSSQRGPLIGNKPGSGGGGDGSHPSSNSHHKKLRFALAKERKASTTLGIIMSAFIVCWLPFFVLALVRPFLPATIPPSLSSLFLWLGYANSLFNPIIYATLNRDFRKPFQEILYFRCGSLNHMMREEFYQSQYGDPDHNQYYVINTTQHVARSSSCYREDIPGEETVAAEVEEEESEECTAATASAALADESFL
ncbi:5-hydroxytryptamine receptor 1 [Anabrus simplex]|uniref:5-hydroxytryptamine receptor 1 n=1 Tax=Anabrus simplex TaxID=316456 RepID=UPI0035A36759